MKNVRLKLLCAVLLAITVLLCACEVHPQKAPPSASVTNAAALSSPATGLPTSVTPAASTPAASAPGVTAPGLPSVGVTSPAPSPNVSLFPVKPSLSVTLSPVSPQPSITPSPAKPSFGLVSPGVTMPQVTKIPDLLSPFKYEEKTYTSGVISIKYPQIVGYSDQAVQTKLNKLIADSAQRDLAALKTETALAAYEITDSISLSSAGLISICFDGYSNYQGAAHPNRFFYSVNIDVKKQQLVTLSQLVTVSKDFMMLFQNAELRPNGIDLTPAYVSAVKDSLNNLGVDFWVQQLQKADSSGEVSSFLTKDALGISIGVSHVMGDHAEFLIKYSALQGFKTNDVLWKDLDK